MGLVAIAVLLLVTNWFFHRVYWSEWIGRFHRQRKRLEKVSRTGFISAQALGLLILGLTSIYREGFETVLFLQSLELSAGDGHGPRGRPRSACCSRSRSPRPSSSSSTSCPTRRCWSSRA